MSHWEPSLGASNEWYTPAYIFDALGVTFDLDVASPPRQTHVPCLSRLTSGALEADWSGFVWMNPPFGGRNGLQPWLDKFFAHGNGIALTPDRTSAPWWQAAARRSQAVLFIDGKVKFERPDGTTGDSPSNGTTLFAAGDRALDALINAADADLGFLSIDREQAIRDLTSTLHSRGRELTNLENGRRLGDDEHDALEMAGAA